MSYLLECAFQNFIKDIIQSKLKTNVNVLNVKVEDFLSPGENYCSTLSRIVVTFYKNNIEDVETLSLISKMPLENRARNRVDYFDCEIIFYKEFFLELQKLKVVNKIAPYPYYLSMQPKQMLVLEDLSALNYKMCNRQKGLDLNHCLLTIKKLAYLHAASLAIYEENPEVISTCRNFQKTSLYDSFFEVSFQETIKACRREPSLQKFVKNIKREFLEKYVTARKPDPNLNVLIHSDFWCNNFLFRYNDDESLNDVLFVDFQINIFASPFYDLHFFLASSPNLEVKKMHTSTILNCYYEAFTNYANDLNVRTKIPNRNEFHKEFRDKAYIGFGTTTTFIHITKAGSWKDASLANFLENGEEGSFRHHCFSNSDYLSHLECSLSFYESLGLFDQ